MATAKALWRFFEPLWLFHRRFPDLQSTFVGWTSEPAVFSRPPIKNKLLSLHTRVLLALGTSFLKIRPFVMAPKFLQGRRLVRCVFCVLRVSVTVVLESLSEYGFAKSCGAT